MTKRKLTKGVGDYEDQVILDAIFIYGLRNALYQARLAYEGLGLYPLSPSARKMYEAFLRRHGEIPEKT